MTAPYIEHQRTEAQGFEIIDATQSGGTGFDHDDLIWIGVYGEGRWLTADEAEQLAGAIFGAAAIHRARTAEGVPA
jgi:hypothetical protein